MSSLAWLGEVFLAKVVLGEAECVESERVRIGLVWRVNGPLLGANVADCQGECHPEVSASRFDQIEFASYRK